MGIKENQTSQRQFGQGANWYTYSRAMALPANLQKEVEAIQASSVPVNQQADSICKLLVKHGFAQHHQALTPASMLVHPSNRAGSMLSFHQGKTNATCGHGRPTSGRLHLL